MTRAPIQDDVEVEYDNQTDAFAVGLHLTLTSVKCAGSCKQNNIEIRKHDKSFFVRIWLANHELHLNVPRYKAVFDFSFEKLKVHSRRLNMDLIPHL